MTNQTSLEFTSSRSAGQSATVSPPVSPPTSPPQAASPARSSSPPRVWAVEMPRKAPPSPRATGWEALPPPPQLPVTSARLREVTLPRCIVQSLDGASAELTEASSVFSSAVAEIESDSVCATGVGGSIRPGALEASRALWTEKQLMLERAGARGLVVGTVPLVASAPLGMPVSYTGGPAPAPGQQLC